MVPHEHHYRTLLTILKTTIATYHNYKRKKYYKLDPVKQIQIKKKTNNKIWN